MIQSTILQFINPFPWALYSKKLIAKIENPRNVGYFSAEDAKARGMRLIEAVSGDKALGNYLKLYWLVDEDDGIIVDAKFQVFGQTALIGASDAACEVVIGKNYDQARRIGVDIIDKLFRDRQDESAFPKETFPHLNLVIEALEHGASQCTDIPFAANYVAPPVPSDEGIGPATEYPGWKELSLKQKLLVIEEVLSKEIRPYIALDGGGVEVLNLLNDQEVVIAYQGSCTSCFSSTGATLSYIQQVLQHRIYPDLIVVPNFD